MRPGPPRERFRSGPSRSRPSGSGRVDAGGAVGRRRRAGDVDVGGQADLTSSRGGDREGAEGSDNGGRGENALVPLELLRGWLPAPLAPPNGGAVGTSRHINHFSSR